MSRGGRPSERAKREPPKRNLAGPQEILRSIETSGGVPDEVLAELGNGQPTPAAEQAGAYMEGLAKFVASTPGAFAPEQQDPNHQMAWTLSMLRSMSESVPEAKRCRHVRAADPRVTEIRSVCLLGRGLWDCVECIKSRGFAVLQRNLWPEECDLCGARTNTFYEFSMQVAGTFVTGNVCGGCAAFRGIGSDA
jgi:hypothetical protein